MTAEQLSWEQPRPLKLGVDEFVLLWDAGAFDCYGKTELINGTIYVMSPQHSPHFKAKNRLFRRLADACDRLGRGLEAWSEGSVEMRPDSVPEPDIFVTSEEPFGKLVRLDTVALVVEVAAATLDRDLGEKAELYARHGVPEYWVVDLDGRLLHQLWRPGADGYAERRRSALVERVEAVTVPGLGVETAELV